MLGLETVLKIFKMEFKEKFMNKSSFVNSYEWSDNSF